MIQIAICDDEQDAVALHEKIVCQCLHETGIGGKINTYTRSSNLLCDITEDKFFFDLILLDIEMPESSGMEMAEKIRPFLPEVKIIFITSHIEYAIDAFELSVFRYVPKDDLEKRLPNAIRDAVKLIALEEGKVYSIRTNSRWEKIPYKDIFYIQRDGKNAVITAGNGVYKVFLSGWQCFGGCTVQDSEYRSRRSFYT